MTDIDWEDPKAAAVLDELSREAYAAYGAFTEWKNYQGLPMPRWAELPPRIQEAWKAASARVAELSHPKFQPGYGSRRPT